MKTKTYILDTNIILDNPDNLIMLSEGGKNKVIISETVLDEVDSKKSGINDINFNAREFARLLQKMVRKNQWVNGPLTYVDIEDEDTGIKISLISKSDYDCKNENVERNIFNDRKILEVAQEYDFQFGKTEEVIFISLDVMCESRAVSLGLKTETLRGKDQKEEFVFHKHIIVPRKKNFDGADILDIDPSYEPMNYSYTLELKSTGEHILGRVENGKFWLLDQEVLNDQSVIPMNKEQKFFVDAIIQNHANILMIDAKAGSGKTLISLATAMRLVKQRQYSKIIYVRNSIESLDKGEDIGYLSGNEEKFRIYNHPLYDNLEYIIRAEIKATDKLEAKLSNDDEFECDSAWMDEAKRQYRNDYGIETMWVGEMRGRTISNAIVIVDEASNMSNKTMQLVLSRIDKTCKVIVIGSNQQIDNFFTNKYINGLSTLLKSSNEKHEEVKLWAGELTKVLRGPITAFAERIFS
jgi:PhoH-like ATPase